MDWELTWWIGLAVLLYIPVFLELIGFNWDCLKKDDPYKNCPKDDF